MNHRDVLLVTNQGFQSTGGSPQIVHDYTEPNPINTNEPYLEFLQYLSGLHDPDIPQVLTISYGENEQTVCRMSSDQEVLPQLLFRFLKITHEEFAISLPHLAPEEPLSLYPVVTTGKFSITDHRLIDRTFCRVGEGNCMTNDGKNQTLFQPAFPAS